MSVSSPLCAPHVLMTADAVGGVWTYALDLGRELVRSGVRVTLAVIGPATDADGQAQAEAAGLELRHLGGELDWTADSEAELAASAARLAALVAELRPHLLHLNSPTFAAFQPFPVPVLAACHSCVATWWSAVKGEAPLPPELAWRARLTARGYAAADVLLAPSRAFAEATRATYRLSTAPHVVLNGRALPLDGGGLGGCDSAAVAGEGGGLYSAPTFHPQRCHPHPCPSPIKGEGTNFDTAVLTAGRLWDDGKDVATLDRAAGRLADSLDVTAAGPVKGPQGQFLTLHHARALGRLSEADLNACLATRPIFVSSSLYEPFGLAVLEAAQAACPLVLSDVATFRELWDGAAVFFPPGDDVALATHLGALAADPGWRADLVEAARARAARYTAAAMADATLQLYARLGPAFARTEAAA